MGEHENINFLSNNSETKYIPTNQQSSTNTLSIPYINNIEQINSNISKSNLKISHTNSNNSNDFIIDSKYVIAFSNYEKSNNTKIKKEEEDEK